MGVADVGCEPPKGQPAPGLDAGGCLPQVGVLHVLSFSGREPWPDGKHRIAGWGQAINRSPTFLIACSKVQQQHHSLCLWRTGALLPV